MSFCLRLGQFRCELQFIYPITPQVEGRNYVNKLYMVMLIPAVHFWSLTAVMISLISPAESRTLDILPFTVPTFDTSQP